MYQADRKYTGFNDMYKTSNSRVLMPFARTYYYKKTAITNHTHSLTYINLMHTCTHTNMTSASLLQCTGTLLKETSLCWQLRTQWNTLFRIILTLLHQVIRWWWCSARQGSLHLWPCFKMTSATKVASFSIQSLQVCLQDGSRFWSLFILSLLFSYAF